MAHHESILLSMLGSSKPEERSEAVDIIFEIREKGPLVWDTPTRVRPFKREDHQVNMAALSIQTLNKKPINLAETEPPATKGLSGFELMALKDQPLLLDLPANSVAVERGIKDITKAANVCCDS